MAYREVTMVEIREVLRLWLAGVPKKVAARRLGLDPKTVRRYVAAAEEKGVDRSQGEAGLTEELFTEILVALKAPRERPRGKTWARCEEQRTFIRGHLRDRVRLTKVRKLLGRRGVDVPYATLHRFAVAELEFGRRAPTVAVADGKPGEEIQLDTGWMTYLEPDLFGKRRRFRAWIFTPAVSRFRFVWPCFRETTETAIEACEEAWKFYGGIFGVIIPDNTKTIVDRSDPTHPRINRTFLEYAQARGFHIDPTRRRSPKDKARTERSVPFVREDCFGGERFQAIDQTRDHARHWCLHDAGMHRHGRTHRLPREHFEAEEKSHLADPPTERYDVPLWCDPKVGRDHLAQVAKALYSLPTRFIGRKLTARADRHLVRFYDDHRLVKTHPRQPPGGRSIDPADYPEHKTAYALRDVAYLRRQAASHGESVGRYAEALLDAPLPWTRMRRVYALLGLVRRYGAARVEEACRIALEADIVNVRRLERILTRRQEPQIPRPVPKVIPLARYLRPASQFAVERHGPSSTDPGDDS
ncbi:MAG: transposase [Myxococcota bacterium]